MDKNVINTFSGGLDWDSHVSNQTPDTYRYALNAITSDLYQDTFISNEHSNRKFVDLGSTITGEIHIQSKDSTIYFTDAGEIWMVSHKHATKTFVCSDTEFGCDWKLGGCEWIQGVYQYIYSCNELLIYWSSACEYRWINVDEMLSPKRKAALKSSIEIGKNCKADPNCKAGCGERTCDYFKVFKGVNAPRATAFAYENGGTSALAGTYEFIARYKDLDGNTSNWFYPTDPVNLGSPHNIAGERSFGHIEVKFSNLDCSYHYLEIAMLKTLDGGVSAERFDLNYSSSNSAFNYYGQEGIPIDISEVLERRKKTYVKGRSLFQHGGRLFPYRLKQERNVDWQYRVNNISAEWVAYETTLEYAQKNNLKTFVHGESYAFGIGLNFLDYTKSGVFHIPNGGSGIGPVTQSDALTPIHDRPTSNKENEAIQGLEERSSTGQVTGEGNETQATIPTITYTPKKYTRDREQKPNTAGATNTDEEYEQSLADAVSQIETDFAKICTAANCVECATDACTLDKDDVDKALKDWENMLAGFTEDKLSIKELIIYTPAKLKEAADALIAAVKNRERVKEEAGEVEIGSSESSPGSQDLEARGTVSGSIYDGQGRLLSNEQLKIVDHKPFAVKTEESIKYAYTKNCDGDNIYGGLAGQNVKHFRFPSEAEIGYFKSSGSGVPSKESPDADEHKNTSVILLGVRFFNIVLPSPEELSKELNKTNPYTIYMIERTDANKTVLAKGIGIRTYVASHKGTSYVYSRHAGNSFETVEKTINIGGSRMIQNPTPHPSFLFFSPDTMFRNAALNATGIVDIGELTGTGYRHNLYAEGIPPDNQLYGTRVDQRGTCQAINLNVFTKGSGSYTNPIPCTGSSYVEAGTTAQSPSSEMSTYSLMNKYKESCLWVGGQLPALKGGVTGESDASFVGDTLDHAAPIHNAAVNIVALVRNLPDQYGALPNAAYIPILQAGEGATSSIEGLCGDAFTNPLTIKRSGYVSDKVGNLFPIGGGSGTAPARPSNKKEDRSVKDNPEDVIKSYIGMWYPSKLPKTGDVADAKNWAGLHTIGNTVLGWNDAKTRTAPDSHFYYPRVVKTLLSFTVQSTVNTNKRVIDDELKNKWYPKLGKYYIGSHAPDNHDWKQSFLNLFGFEVNQPSTWKQMAKVMIRSIIGLIMPMMPVSDLVNLEGPIDTAGFFAGSAMLMAMWLLMNQVLFTNDWIDQMLGIPLVKTDEEGGEDDSNLHGFHDNFAQYNWSYSKMNNYIVDRGIPDPYYTCKCDDCMSGQTTNEIIFSNKQFPTSAIDSYKNFAGLDYLILPSYAGKLYKMFSNGNKIYAHCEDSLYVIDERQVESDSFQTGLYLQPYQIGENVPEGLYGLIDPKAAISTQYGYFWIDRQARKVYQFDRGIVEISAFRMHNFFKDYLNFCQTGNCIDEKSGTYYSMGVDPRLNRLLLTKVDPVSSWTISYSFLKKKWISFHSYAPVAYMWDRDDLYSIKGSEVWIHKNNDEGEGGDETECSFQSFFGTKYPHIIDFVVKDKVDNYLNAFMLNSLILDTQACNCENNNLTLLSRKETFDQIGIYNSYQTAGLLNLVLRDPENAQEGIRQNVCNSKLEFQHNQFRTNSFYDVTMDYCAPLVKYSKCNPQLELINYDFTKGVQSVKYLQDTYFNVRLILNKNNIKLYTRYILPNIEKIVR